MSGTNTWEAAIQDLFWLNIDMTGVGNAGGLRGSTVPGSFYFSAHTTFPGEGGNQSSNEVAYTSYARVAVPRSGTGFTRTGNEIVNANTISFPKCTGSTAEITYIGCGDDLAGAGVLHGISLVGATTLPLAFTAKADDSLTIPGHTFTTSAPHNRVALFAIPGSTLPTGSTEGTVYYVKTASGDDITLSTTDGGATVNLTSTGNGVCQKCVPLSVSVNITPIISAGQFVHQLD